MTKSAFLLTAGFGTRFQPHTDFLPKPALPFFNLPQALYPAGLLKNIGVTDFFYNSHHLPKELDEALNPFFKKNSLFEKDILDSAGGIANAKAHLMNDDHFWAVNGDSFITTLNDQVLLEAYDFHVKTNSIATLIGIKKDDLSLNGLGSSSDNVLTHTAKGPDTLHFVGIYLFSKEIFNFIRPEKSHILKDVLLKNFQEKVSVFNAHSELIWFETGNEKDFIECHRQEAKNILAEKENSTVYKTFETWGLSPEKQLEQFLKNNIWGKESSNPHKSDFLILPENLSDDSGQFKNCVIINDLSIPKDQSFENRVLIDPSQWA
ncbi:MAG: nucleotidyltransferase family protein [Bdellovibrionales bacterium]